MTVTAAAPARGPLVYRQRVLTRIAHWAWAASLFFLLLSGLQIFNAHPTLYWGQESGFEYDNAVLRIGAREGETGPEGITTVLGREVETTGVLGWSGGAARGFPAWATIPSTQDLATGRVVHFFFAWVLFGTLVAWGAASLLNGHLREIVPTASDLRALPGDILNHARLRLHRTHKYNVLQKLAYAGVLLVLFPLMFLTGLSMSPSFNALAPWLLDVLGGRQSARTIHFVAMVLLVLFFAVHILMILLAGPLNEMRSIVTGWYRIDPEGDAPDQPRPISPGGRRP
jgi:thiosulfate reductase cytochrome b subunit